jgi:hypothetical protein
LISDLVLCFAGVFGSVLGVSACGTTTAATANYGSTSLSVTVDVAPLCGLSTGAIVGLSGKIFSFPTLFVVTHFHSGYCLWGGSFGSRDRFLVRWANKRYDNQANVAIRNEETSRLKEMSNFKI